MMSPEVSTIFVLVLFGTASFCGIAWVRTRSVFLRRLGIWLTVLAFASQTLMLLLGFHKTMPDGLSAGAYIQLLAWFVMLGGIVVWRGVRQATPLLCSVPLCLALFAVSLPCLDAVVTLPASVQNSFYALHIGALFSSLGLLSIAFFAGLIFLFLEGRIKNKQHMPGFWQDMPAIFLLDKINAFAVLTAFPLYTLGIISGMAWAEPVFGTSVTGDPKEVMSIVIWLVFGVLFHYRLIMEWKGRKPARWAVCIFLLCLFSFVVINTIMNTHHTFIRG
ncbi:MAG: cytochrome c biogenesis protein [Desulfovibrio sp.]|jgi:ABC-type transport system involved in cytochrome c biogenesis permease subunit|nr:cytochrome c biogenesis protein [Desulfovibrio sp.]